MNGIIVGRMVSLRGPLGGYPASIRISSRVQTIQLVWDNEECIRCRHELSRSAAGSRPGNEWNPGVEHNRTPEKEKPLTGGRTQAGLGEVCEYVDVGKSK